MQRHSKRGFIQSFTGSHRFVLDYLLEEVLQHQTVEVQDFFAAHIHSRTACVDRFAMPSC